MTYFTISKERVCVYCFLYFVFSQKPLLLKKNVNCPMIPCTFFVTLTLFDFQKCSHSQITFALIQTDIELF